MSKPESSFRIDLRSNAAPFFSDTDSVYVKAPDAMAALRKAIADYDHPCGLFAAGALDSDGEMRARYLSSRANTARKAPGGLTEWRGKNLYVNSKKQPTHPECYEVVE